MIFYIKGHLVISLELLSKLDCVVDHFPSSTATQHFRRQVQNSIWFVGRLQCLTIKWTFPVSMLHLLASILKQFCSVPSFLRTFFLKIKNGYKISSKFFSAFIELCVGFSLLIHYCDESHSLILHCQTNLAFLE